MTSGRRNHVQNRLAVRIHGISSGIFALLLLVGAPACTGPRPDLEKDARPVRSAAETLPAVRTVTAARRDFPLRILSNGRLSAVRRSELHFAAPGVVERIFVAEGRAVRAGQVLARLDSRMQALAVRQAGNQLDEARINLGDHLVRAGGRAGDSTSVGPQVWRLIRIESGYEKALAGLEEARLKLSDTYLAAPYAGVIANLDARPHTPVAAGRPFCTLLDAGAFAIEFPVLESELPAVRTGQAAVVMPVALESRTYAGRVSGVNPLVDEQGLVRVRVLVDRPDGRLLEGMNARVALERSVPGLVVVPAGAVVERSGRKVAFVHEDGLAKWRYVTVAHQNGGEVAVSEGIKAGEQVVVEGNLNLGHDARVRVEQ